MPTDFNAVPDPVETILVPASPPEGSVAPELVQQFIRLNPISKSDFFFCNSALYRIPADKWTLISTFLNTKCQNKIEASKVTTLSKMPLDMLNLVIDFATQHNITSSQALFALSKVRFEEFHSFVQLVEAHELLHKPEIWQALAAMPTQYQEDFIHFCKEKQFDINGPKGVLIFQHHTPEFWTDIDNFLNKVRVSDYVLGRLAEMPAMVCLDYMRFVSTNKVDDWAANNILVDIAESLRYQIWEFVCKHNVNIRAFKKIPEDMWPRVSHFIERHVQPGDTELSEFTVEALIKISDEDWPKFNEFLDTHQIHEFKLIEEYAKMSALQRNYLFDFIQKYQPKHFEIPTFSRVPVDSWPDFLDLVEENQLTNVKQLSAIAGRAPEKWPALVGLIVKYNISNSQTLIGLRSISSQRLHFLSAFVDEYNIDDEHVIFGLTRIPSVRQWVSIYTLAQPLFAPPLLAEDRGHVMRALYEITKQEHRIDRIMPTYDDNERLARIAAVQDRIAQGVMPQNPDKYYKEMYRILNTPANLLGNMHQAEAANARAISVHAEGREGGTEHALQQLMGLPYDIRQIDNDYAALIAYLNHFPGDFTRTSAQFVLGLASSQADGFAPLSADVVITSYGLDITGKEFLARCWHYIQHGEFMGVTDAEALANDRENARVGLIRNLADAYEDGAVVCNPGKLQHIAVGVLQGRLESVHIDREIPIDVQSIPVEIPTDMAVNASLVRNTVASSLRYFLLQYEAAVESQAELKSHVDEWLQAERGLSGEAYQQYREDFRKELDEYLKLSHLPEETVIEMASHTNEHLTLQVKPQENLSPVCEKEQQVSEVTITEQNAVSNTALCWDEVQVRQQEQVLLKRNYTNLLNTLAQNIETGTKPRWTSGSKSQKVQVLRALETFVNNQDANWVIDAANQTKLLTLIKSICSTHRNWVPVHFGPPTSLGEFLTLVENAPEGYGTSKEVVNALETAVLASEQLNYAVSIGNFNELLDGMPVEQHFSERRTM